MDRRWSIQMDQCAGLRPRDPIAHGLAGPKGEHPTLRDRNFDARLGIATNALALVAQGEGSKTGNLDVLTLLQCLGYVAQERFNQRGGLRLGKSDLTVQHVCNVCPR